MNEPEPGSTWAIPFGLDQIPATFLHIRRRLDTERWVFLVDHQYDHGPDCPHIEEHETYPVPIPHEEVQMLPCKPLGHWLKQARQKEKR